MTELNTARRRELRSAAHHLHPVVSISHNGLSESVLKEVDLSLKAHQLIKVKLHGVERDDRDALIHQICATLDCASVQQIGNILVLWREKPAQIVPSTQPTTRPAAKRLTKRELVDKPRRRAPR